MRGIKLLWNSSVFQIKIDAIEIDVATGKIMKTTMNWLETLRNKI